MGNIDLMLFSLLMSTHNVQMYASDTFCSNVSSLKFCRPKSEFVHDQVWNNTYFTLAAQKLQQIFATQ